MASTRDPARHLERGRDAVGRDEPERPGGACIATAADEHPAGALGLSTLGYQFLAGVLHSADALAALFNPTVNSYKRINAPPTVSGASWSPSSTVRR